MPLIRNVIILLMMNYCVFCFSQTIQYSQEYASVKGNVALGLINNHPRYFYLLRYNKPAHDFTIERRSKPDARMLSFTPLRLDSVNATWFDYEKLDYTWFESGAGICFVFEKTLNNKKTVYLKIIDTLGRTNGFKELASLDRDASISDFRFLVKATAKNKLLVLGEQYYYNNTAKKVAMLYDPEKGDKAWIKKLPIENELTGFSSAFECNSTGDLFYIRNHSKVLGYKRRFTNGVHVKQPVSSIDSAELVCMPIGNTNYYRQRINLRDSTGLKSQTILATDSSVIVAQQGYRQNEGQHGQVFFLTCKSDNRLQKDAVNRQEPLSDKLNQQLTFYDGTDFEEPWDKDYNLIQRCQAGRNAFLLAGREEENYYKELLLWVVDLENGKTLNQHIIPRKLFYFDDRTRFKNIGAVAAMVDNDTFYAFLLEARGNGKVQAAEFDYHQFGKQKYLSGANLVCYYLKPDGAVAKKVIYGNATFDFIPLVYEGHESDFVFYLNAGKREKFATLSLRSF